MTFNVRYDNPDDGIHSWVHRKARVAAIVERADVIGVQEALAHQVSDLAQMLPAFDWVGVGRDDGAEAGEFAPVFFRRDAFEPVTSGTFWLSEEPEIPGSIGWDAALARIATWVQLRHRASGASLWVFNAHFDHRGREARRQSAALLTERVEQMRGGDPVVVTGDFNAGDTTAVYRRLTAGHLADAMGLAGTTTQASLGTFSGFEAGARRSQVRIDHIFVERGIPVHSFAIIEDLSDGRYPSDHRPVAATVSLHP